MLALMLAVVLAFTGPVAQAAVTAKHPLDPLSRQEIATAVSVLKTAGHVNENTRFSSLTLREPSKTEVLKWKPATPFRREVFTIIVQGGNTYEAVVDVAALKLESWQEIKGVQPSIPIEVTAELNDILRADSGWQAAMHKRGIRRFDKIQCMPFSAGYFGIPEEEGRRLVRTECYDAGSSANYWGRPIEGLVATVDLNQRRVLKLIDTGVVPIPQGPADYDMGAVQKTGAVTGPASTQGTKKAFDFTVSDSEVTWQNWSFRVRMDPRFGIVLSTIGFNDGGRIRSVMYEGHLSEIFVPYMDPSPAWYFRTYMDAGEYGAGKLASTLEPGSDCPANAYFFDDWIADGHGVPQQRPRIACLFERTDGEIAWRHYDFIANQTVSRPGRELVLRWIATVGNYDYVFDWRFEQNGTIKVAVGATGIDEVKGVASKSFGQDHNNDAAYGSFVADNLVAVNHDHFFCFKLDLDVDGTANSFETAVLKKVRLDSGSLRRSAWVVQPKIAEVESEGKLNEDMHEPALWRVINPAVKGASGYPTGYQLIPGHATTDMLDADDYPRRRAGFADYQLWVTAYTSEQAAAGHYPNQSKGGDGLPQWTKQNRSIENSDIVLWYTIGFHHVPQSEDWPVLPTMWHEFYLRPSGFFSHNPTVNFAAPMPAKARAQEADPQERAR